MPPLATLLFLVACSDNSVTKTNAAPEATVTFPSDGAEVVEGSAVDLRGSAADPDDAASDLMAAWYRGADAICPPSAPEPDGTTTCTTTATEGADAITLEVRDPDGAVATAAITLNGTTDTPPTVEIVAPTEGSRWYSDRLVTLEGLVTDDHDEASALTLTWESSQDGLLDVTLTVDSDGSVSGVASLQVGEHQLTFSGTDTVGNQSSDSVVVSVTGPNTAPVCGISAPEDGGVTEPDVETVLRGTVTDIDESATAIAASWSSDRQGLLGNVTPTSTGEVTLSARLQHGTHLLTLAATDEAGATCSASVSYTVTTRPSAEILTPAVGDVVQQGDQLTLTGTAHDPETPPELLDVTWESDIDGFLDNSPAAVDGTLAATIAGLSVGEHTLTLTVTDSNGLDGTDTVTFQVAE